MPANRNVMTAVREMIANNPDAAKAMAAMRLRGMRRKDAEEEIARALLGCMWEASRNMPDRWPSVIAALEQGRSAEELFPDDFYRDGP